MSRQFAGLSVDCEVITNVDSGEKTSGMKRNELMAVAAGRYVAFIDDDDTVADNYVESICNAIMQEDPDVVTFAMDVRITKTFKHRVLGKTRFSQRSSREKWQLGLWPDDRRKSRMSANHLCCWKKEIARKSAWCDHLGYGDDQLWYGPLHALSAAKTSVVINECLYFYKCNVDSSANQTSARIAEAKAYFGAGIRCFGDLDSLLIEDGRQDSVLVQCRDSAGSIWTVDTSVTEPFHTVKLL